MKTKKFLILTCCLIICSFGIMLSGCGSSGYAGTWKATSAKVQDIQLDINDVFGGFEITLNEDGTCTRTIQGESDEGTWEQSEKGVNVIIGADTMKLVDKDGTLKTNYGGATMVFEK